MSFEEDVCNWYERAVVSALVFGNYIVWERPVVRVWPEQSCRYGVMVAQTSREEPPERW